MHIAGTLGSDHLLFDELSKAVSVATAIRDRDGRILDFRIVFVNRAAARWAGVERSALVGLLAGDVLPGLRASGLFEALRTVVASGEPLAQIQVPYRDAVLGGQAIDGVYDLHAIRLGDGYISTWRPTEARPARS